MARPRDQRIKDTLELLQTEVDVWIATASGAAMIVTTMRSSQTGRNFDVTGRARAAIGQTRGQVVVIDARVEEMPVGENVELEDAYVRATDFDPRPWDVGYTFFRLTPERIQAWRGDDAEELRDRDLMRDGMFL